MFKKIILLSFLFIMSSVYASASDILLSTDNLPGNTLGNLSVDASPDWSDQIFVSEVKTFTGKTCDSLFLLDDTVASSDSSEQGPPYNLSINQNVTITDYKLLQAFGPGMGCFRMDYKNDRSFSTGNVQMEWDPVLLAYTKINPINVKITEIL